MKPNEFIAKRFEMSAPLELHIGDEVITKDYHEKGIVIRETYYIGTTKEAFTTVFYGSHISTNALANLEKTGKHYPEMETILNKLRGE